MPEMDGFTLLQHLDRKNMPHIILTTAYEEYAIRAFEFHALDYLLKPFDQARSSSALDHAEITLQDSESDPHLSAQIDALMNAIEQIPRSPERLLAKRNGRIVFVKFKDVDWTKADGKYLHLQCGKSNHMIRQTLQAIKLQLDPMRFVQINRSVIVNIDSIQELHTTFNGDRDVQIVDGGIFNLSRSHKQEVFQLLGKPVG